VKSHVNNLLPFDFYTSNEIASDAKVQCRCINIQYNKACRKEMTGTPEN